MCLGVTLALLWSCSHQGTRAVPPRDRNGEILAEFPQRVMAATAVHTRVTVKNGGSEPWPADGNVSGGARANLAYHWTDESSRMVEFDGVRTALPNALAPGKSITVEARVVAPPKPGDYLLRFDVVQESVAWFGLQARALPVHVIPSPESSGPGHE